MTVALLVLGMLLVLSVWILVAVHRVERAVNTTEDREVIAGFTLLPTDDEEDDE